MTFSIPDAVPTRARPLAVEERQAMIIDAVIPLLVEFGPTVTSRQIADAAGIAEGTIYRAFGDKETLIRAAVEKHLDPEPLRHALAQIDPMLPLEAKVHTAVSLMQGRFREIFGLMAIFNEFNRPPSPQSREGFISIFQRMLEPDRHRLNCEPKKVAQIIRLLTFSSSLPQLNDGVTYSTDELTEIVLHGIAGTSAVPADVDADDHTTAGTNAASDRNNA